MPKLTTGRWSGERTVRRNRFGTGSKHRPVRPGEHQTVRFVGVARDVEGSVVLTVMMERTETCKVVGVRGPAMLPVDDVVHFQALAGAARVPAGAVTIQHGTPCVARDGAGHSAHIDGLTAGDDVRMDGAVAQDLRAHISALWQ